jgi:hypothetical protein
MRGRLDETATAAEYFAACAWMAIDLINGGAGLNQVFKKAISGHKEDIDPGIAPLSALVMFLTTLHEHPAFNPQQVLQASDPNHDFFRQIASLLQKKVDDIDARKAFIALLPQFKVDGIRQIKVTECVADDQKVSYRLFINASKIATERQPYGPYSDAYSCPPPTR